MKQFPKRVTCPTCPKCRGTRIQYFNDDRTCLECRHQWSTLMRKPQRQALTPLEHLERITRPFE
jgi:hypothetical protein